MIRNSHHIHRYGEAARTKSKAAKGKSDKGRAMCLANGCTWCTGNKYSPFSSCRDADTWSAACWGTRVKGTKLAVGGKRKWEVPKA